MHSWRKLLAAGLAVATLTCLAASAVQVRAQQGATAWPNQTIRIVVGFGAGGGNDILARLLADKMSKSLGQPVIVENKPGGGGGVAASFVKSQPADGYTLLVGASGAMAVGPAVGVPASYDSVTDFEPVSLLATFPLVVLVNAESPHKTLAELIAWSKGNAASANYASSSPTFTLATELFKLKTGASLQRVPYRSSNEMVLAVVGKQVTVAMTDPLPAVPQVRDGKLRALAVTSTSRLPELPNVPTMAEAGVSGAEAIFWSGLFAPRGTPRDILNRLEREVRAAMQDTQVRERLRALATDAASSTPAEFAARIKTDIEMWSGVAKAANVTID